MTRPSGQESSARAYPASPSRGSFITALVVLAVAGVHAASEEAPVTVRARASQSRRSACLKEQVEGIDRAFASAWRATGTALLCQAVPRRMIVEDPQVAVGSFRQPVGVKRECPDEPTTNLSA